MSRGTEGLRRTIQQMTRSPFGIGATHQKWSTAMDKDRIEGSAKQAGGSIKEAAGKALGDKKMQAEGTAKKVEGKIQNAAGGIKDAVREANREANKPKH
jgi:uncharacterized protein YjbJ (UPF0337 family)